MHPITSVSETSSYLTELSNDLEQPDNLFGQRKDMLAQHDYDDRPSASVLTVYAFHSDTAIGNATVGIDGTSSKLLLSTGKERTLAQI